MASISWNHGEHWGDWATQQWLLSLSHGYGYWPFFWYPGWWGGYGYGGWYGDYYPNDYYYSYDEQPYQGQVAYYQGAPKEPAAHDNETAEGESSAGAEFFVQAQAAFQGEFQGCPATWRSMRPSNRRRTPRPTS